MCIRDRFRSMSYLKNLTTVVLDFEKCDQLRSANIDLTQSAAELEDLNINFRKCTNLRSRGFQTLCKTIEGLRRDAICELDVDGCPLSCVVRRKLYSVLKKNKLCDLEINWGRSVYSNEEGEQQDDSFGAWW
eukprot:TRINITY_DN9489_c0_g1_i2.p1 TRINITY_DN9489_c0_g1~~TRINITY_DN9489_c0_g1_i2.p1  ORF type:complete len:151 (+),score=10.33 TRINITY_DN9489_c0_g1_i2:60-455(+)